MKKPTTSTSVAVSAVALFFTTNLLRTGAAVRFLGYEAEWRDNEDNVKRAILILDPTQRADRGGFVTGWHVYTTRGRRSQTVHLQIWRPIRPTERRYQLVGETVIVALWVGHNYFALYPRDRIPVQRGDVLGIYFPKYNPIPWSAAKCHGDNKHLYKYNPYSVTMQLAAGHREVVFDTGRKDWNPCRHYSLNATIMNDIEMRRYDEDYEQTTDGRYERRPYGAHLPTRGGFYSDASTTRPSHVTSPLVILVFSVQLSRLFISSPTFSVS